MARVTKADRLLVIGRGAGNMNEGLEARLREEFADHVVVDFAPRLDVSKLLKPGAGVVLAGGDGTVEHVVRGLVDSDHPLGIIPLGSFNNFARALGLPLEPDEAVQVAKHGRLRSITVGRVNRRVFLEACAVGLFGEAIVLGESAKDLQFGTLVQKIGDVIGARPFQYELTGDLEGTGTAMSLVFSNTSSIGSQLPVSVASPMDPYLELAADAGKSHVDIVGRALASALLDKHEEEASGRMFRFTKVSVRTSPRVRVYADNRPAGRTPAVVEAAVSAVKVRVSLG